MKVCRQKTLFICWESCIRVAAELLPRRIENFIDWSISNDKTSVITTAALVFITYSHLDTHDTVVCTE